MLRSRLLRSIARLWWLRVYVGSAGVPLPRDAPAVRSGAADADRVLVLGNGAASGWGVLTHGLGLTGRLAARLQGATGRPCDVELLGDDVMNAGSAPEWLGDRPLDGYDAVVVVLGFSDALRQTSPLLWRAELERLLHVLLHRVRPTVEVLVTGIEPVSSAAVFRGPLARLAQRNADRLNAATRELAAETPRIRFVELPRPDEGERARYDDWAAALAVAAAPLVDRARTSADRVRGEAREVLAPPVPVPADPAALLDLLHRAKQELHADLAWVGLRDGDRQVIAASTEERSPSSVPMDLTFCRYTESADDTVVVADAPADPRFAGNPFLDVLHLEAYVGHPLHDADGAVIGTFCVAAIRPRPGFAGAAAQVERYARRAEHELRRPAPVLSSETFYSS